MTEQRQVYAAGDTPPESMITQIFQFADGSRIKIIVEAWPGRYDDTASDLYYALLAPMMAKLERGKR